MMVKEKDRKGGEMAIGHFVIQLDCCRDGGFQAKGGKIMNTTILLHLNSI